MSANVVSPDVASIAYLQAWDITIDWAKIFSAKVEKALRSFAQKKNTSMEIIVSLLFLLTSSVMGPSTTFFSANEFSSNPILYLMAVSMPNAGKSHLIKMFASDVVAHLKTEGLIDDIFMETYTYSGFLRHLTSTSGHIMYITDEICHELANLFSTRNNDNLSFRRNLNNFWFGSGFNKKFSTAANIDVDETYFVLGGTTQPQQFMEVLAKILANNDGLPDRIFCLTSNPLPEEVENPHRSFTADDEWIKKLFEQFGLQHPKGTKREYVFDQEAIEFLNSRREMLKAAHKERVLDFQKKVRAQETIEKVPNLSGQGKVMDMTERAATILHALDFGLDNFARGDKPVTLAAIPLTISLDTVKKADKLVNLSKLQMDCYITATQECQPATASQQHAVRSVFADNVVDPARCILGINGKIVSIRQIQRQRGSRNSRQSLLAPAIANAMEQLNVPPGDPKFVGIHVRSGNQNLFYKAPPEKCSQEVLDNHGITLEAYKKAYEHDVITDPPANLGPKKDEWAGLYNKWIQKMPQQLKNMIQEIKDQQVAGSSRANGNQNASNSGDGDVDMSESP